MPTDDALQTPEPGWPAEVSIREVGLRDGLQIEDPIPTEAKTRLLDAVVATGVPRVEVTAFVSPRAVPAMADAADVVAHALAHPDADRVRFSALVASVGGARRAVEAGVRTLEYVVSAAEGHSRANVRRTTDEALADVTEIAGIAHEVGGTCEVVVATAWDCPFDGPTPTERTVDVVRRAIDLGADEICLGDTIGTTTPARTLRLLDAVRDVTGDLPLAAHFHDTRGAGIANAVVAVRDGITRLDASVGAMGGCPFAPGASGNIATEEVVQVLDDANVRTGLDLARTLEAAALAQELVGHPLDSDLLRAGGLSVPTP